MQVGLFTDRQQGKTVPVNKDMVREAYRQVRSKGGAAGADGQSLEEYNERLQDNLYKLWNRLASGSYFPPPVREVEIPKAHGEGKRRLGVPTIRDKIAQRVVKEQIEGRIEAHFHENTYGYRPHRGAQEALEHVRKNCFQHAWAIDIDIKGFFDNIDHELLMRAVDNHIEEKWVRMYIRSWLEAPIKKAAGQLEYRQGKGTPQGGVISPLLANLFLHYVLDQWLQLHYKGLKFVRYADDVIIHCDSRGKAEEIQEAVNQRLQECNLELNRAKTRIVYCKDYKRTGKYKERSFDFLGYRFQPRGMYDKRNGKEIGYSAAISPGSR